MNELGLDPGIDHCSAAALIEEARGTGNEVSRPYDRVRQPEDPDTQLGFQLVSFVSFCGGLPEPALSGGPLGYKFSWVFSPLIHHCDS